MRITKRARITVLSLVVCAGVAACADPIGPQGDDPPPAECVWIKGVLHCDEDY